MFYIEEYKDWLASLIKIPYGYNKLVNQLFLTPFLQTREYDLNRSWDGVSLRGRYITVKGIHPDELTYVMGGVNCTMLELMVSIALKCESVMFDGFSDSKVDYYFMQMLYSLGLDVLDDDNFDIFTYDSIIEAFENGEILLFDIEASGDLDLWAQATNFLTK